MKTQILLGLCLAACLASCHARRNAEYDEYKGNGYKPKYNEEHSYDEHDYKQQHPKPYKGDGYKAYKDISYKGDKYYEEDSYKGDKYYKEGEGYGEDEKEQYGKEEYGDEYEKEGYGEGYKKEGYGGDYDYYKEKDLHSDEGYYSPDNMGYPRDDYYGDGDVDCTNPNKWPANWQGDKGLLCVNPYSGVRKVFNATTCKETNGCYEWKGTDKSCTFKFSGPDKCCREAEGVCDVPEFCTGSSGKCPNNEYKQPNADEPCRVPEGVCEFPVLCPGNSKDCPARIFKIGTVCNSTTAAPCDIADVCVDKNPNCPPKFAGPSVTCGKAADPNLPCDAQDTCSDKANVCIDRVVPKSPTTWCNQAGKLPCTRGGKCDGKAKTCPHLTPAPIGTPCRKDMPSELEEAYDALTGMVAVKGDYSKDHVEQHGWVECDRCYGFECQTFKWEYWNTADGGHYSESHKSSSHKSSESHSSGSHKSSGGSHKSHSGPKSSSHSSGSHSNNGHKTEAGAYAATEAQPTEEFYPTGLFEYLESKQALTASDNQASIQGDYGYGSSGHHKYGKGSYVPDVYCHNPYTIEKAD